MELYKAVIAGGSNNSGIWGRSPQPPEANGGSGAELRRFLQFLSQKYAFLSKLSSKFLLKTLFK